MKDFKKELLQIVEEEGIDYISFNEYTFTVKFGDVENTDVKGNVYTLLDTYVEIPYTFTANEAKLHRGIVDIEECSDKSSYRYSGFVHYNGNNFCYGECGVEKITNSIKFNGVLTADLLNMLLVKFKVYLSQSSHGTTGNYKKLSYDTKTKLEYSLLETTTINDIKYPSVLEVTSIDTIKNNLDYKAPYKELTKVESKKFTYNGKEIIPIIVKHSHYPTTTNSTSEMWVNIEEIQDRIITNKLKKVRNEINNTRTFTLQDFIH